MTQTYAQKIIEQRISNKNQNKKMNYNEYSESYNDYNDLSRYYDLDYGIPQCPKDVKPVEDPKKTEKTISYVAIYKSCGKYYVSYKGNFIKGKKFSFDSIDKANNFLKIIYNHLDAEVYCSNLTVKNCNFKSVQSFFFMSENNEEIELETWSAYKQVPLLKIKIACLIKCGYWPKLNNAQKQHMIENLKDFSEPFVCEMSPGVIWFIVASVLSAVLICASPKPNTCKKYQSSEQKIGAKVQTVTQEYEAQKVKTINFTDSINQKTK